MIKVSRAIAANTDLVTAQSFVYPHRLESGESEYLFLVVSASGEDIFIKVRQKGLQLEEWFFGSLQAIPNKLNQGANTLVEYLNTATNLEVVLGFLDIKGRLYLKFYGSPKVVLDRHGQLLDPLEGFSENQLISGNLLEGDKVLFATVQTENQDNRLESRFIKQLLSSDGESLEDEIEMYYQRNNLLDPVAVVLIDKPVTTIDQLAYGQTKNNAIFSKLSLKFSNIKSKLALIGLLVVLLIVGSIFLFNSFSQKQLNNQKQTANKTNTQTQNNSYEISNWPIFLSLDLIKPNFAPKKLSNSLGSLLLLDESQQSLVLLDMTKKTNTILAGSSQLGNVRDASLYTDYVYAYSEDKGVSQIDLNTNKINVIIKPDPEWGYIKSIYAFAGNVYLLDSIKNQVWKYVPVKAGYSDKVTYLTDGVKADFTGSKQMFIDSSVWVLKREGEILKFTSGNKDFFSPAGLDKPLKEITAIYVSEKEDRVYLLDAENARLVVLKKNGEYYAQYNGDKFKAASNLMIDDKAKKIFLLEGSKLYQLDLR